MIQHYRMLFEQILREKRSNIFIKFADDYDIITTKLKNETPLNEDEVSLLEDLGIRDNYNVESINTKIRELSMSLFNKNLFSYEELLDMLNFFKGVKLNIDKTNAIAFKNTKKDKNKRDNDLENESLRTKFKIKNNNNYLRFHKLQQPNDLPFGDFYQIRNFERDINKYILTLEGLLEKKYPLYEL